MKENNSLISFSGYMGRARFNAYFALSAVVLLLVLSSIYLLTSINPAHFGEKYGTGAVETMIGLVLLVTIITYVAVMSFGVRRLRDITNTEKLLSKPLTLVLAILLFVPNINCVLYVCMMFIPGQRTTEQGTYKFIKEMFAA